MKTGKSLILFASFLIMASTIINLYFLIGIEDSYKNLGAYVGVGAIAVLLIALFFLSISENKHKNRIKKLEEKDQEIGKLKLELENTKDIINIAPTGKNDIEM